MTAPAARGRTEALIGGIAASIARSIPRPVPGAAVAESEIERLVDTIVRKGGRAVRASVHPEEDEHSMLVSV